MDISLTTNLNSNASYLQNNQQPAINIDTVIKNGKVFYLCPVEGCPKIFTRRYSLNDHHLSTHDNKKTRSCDICGGRFNTTRLLTQHKQTHGDKNFICYVCDRSFACSKYLNVHNKTQLHKRNINNIPTDHSPYKPDPCITNAKNYSAEVAIKEQSRLNHENKHDPSKLPDSAELVIQEEDYSSDIEKYFNENNLLDIEISSNEDIKPLTAGLNYDKIVAHYL